MEKSQEPIKPIDPLVITFINMFQQEKYGYKILVSSVIVKIFYALYNRLIQVDVKPIEMLSDGEKTFFWNLAKTYYTDQADAIKASKAAYILHTITQSE